MGRKRKRRRRASVADSSGEQAEQETAGGVIEEEDEDSKTSPPAAAAAAPAAAAAAAADASEEEGEAIARLLEPFTRDELLDLLAEACLRDPALLSRLAASAESDAAHRRIFVHGLGPGATSRALAAAFSPFGALEERHAVSDRATGRCRGYGFVTFRRRSAARRALAGGASMRVDGRPVACQLASLGPTATASPSPGSARKLFVGNVPARAAHGELKRFFSRFGEIEEGPLGADRATGQFRGYAIFLYKSPEGLTKALEEPNMVFDGCELQCRRAHRMNKKERGAAAPAEAGARSNGAAAPVPAPRSLSMSSGRSLH